MLQQTHFQKKHSHICLALQVFMNIWKGRRPLKAFLMWRSLYSEQNLNMLDCRENLLLSFWSVVEALKGIVFWTILKIESFGLCIVYLKELFLKSFVRDCKKVVFFPWFNMNSRKVFFFVKTLIFPVANSHI